jgi:methionyl aminopeptidase
MIEKMRSAGRLTSETLDFISPYVKEGISTDELDQLCHDFIVSHGGIPAPLNYKGFPKSICTSINHVVCHGIPGSKKLKSGDIINIDVTVILDGYHGDASRMFKIGKISKLADRLIQVTYDALMIGIDNAKPGKHMGDIGYAIQSYAERYGFSVVRDFCGHGIGTEFHCHPEVRHFGKKGSGVKIQEGMFFTIEPMVNAGRYQTKVLSDGWTAVTSDGSLSAQWEHTIAIMGHGPEILTLS